MRVGKIVLMFAVIAVLLIIILGRPITTDAPQIMGSKEIEDALNAASELDEQNVVRVDIPDGNGGYKTLQGEEATKSIMILFISFLYISISLFHNNID